MLGQIIMIFQKTLTSFIMFLNFLYVHWMVTLSISLMVILLSLYGFIEIGFLDSILDPLFS